MRENSRHRRPTIITVWTLTLTIGLSTVQGQGNSVGNRKDGKHLFENETYGGNGRTCLTCHSADTGTLSPADALKRLQKNPADPLFAFDGSDNRQGQGVSRMLAHATIEVEIALPSNVTLADDPQAKSVILRRGIPTTLNTPALDPVLMYDGRDADITAQALHAIQRHYQTTETASAADIKRITEYELTSQFFSSPALQKFAQDGSAPTLPAGVTPSEIRGRRFFVDTPFVPTPLGGNGAGACAVCHSGPMLNRTNKFMPLPVAPGNRFLTIGVSEGNFLHNPVRNYIFHNADGSQSSVWSADPGRALITGKIDGNPAANGAPFFTSLNAFKIPTLWGVKNTAPYFHDNSGNSLEDVVNFYGDFVFPPFGMFLTPQDRIDIVAYLKLL
jgi:cytochrome c peroxidase